VSLFVTLKTGKVRKFETGEFVMSSDNGHMMIVFAKRDGAAANPLAFIPMALVESVDVEGPQAWPGDNPTLDEKVLKFFAPPVTVEAPAKPEPPKRAF
jgi:hypothetical protein